MIEVLNFINNEFLPSNTNKTIDGINPATEEVFYKLPQSDAMDVISAIQAANSAFPEWSGLSPRERSDWLMKLAQAIEDNLDAFSEAETLDNGKPLWLSKSLDIPRAVENFRFFATRLLHSRSESLNSSTLHNYVEHSPVGAFSLISPWNLPLYLLTWKIAPCLASGNVAICKPSEVTSYTAFLLAKTMKEVNFPAGVCNFIFGYGHELGETLVAHPGIKGVSFTGGTDTGQKIASMSAPHFKKVSLEMGGKNSAIVLKDADIKKAVQTCIRSSFLNQGEICLCTERIFIHQSVYEEFKTLFVEEVKKLKVGNPLDESSFMGPLVSKEHFDKVKASVETAKSDKAKILFGGEALGTKGFYYSPTVMEGLSNCSPLQQDEIFGPVVNLSPFKRVDEAIRKANTTPYGLCATLFTQDLSKAHQLAQKLDVGTVWINTWLKRDLRVPFGGMKSSGMGREGGDYSFEFFTETKTISIEI